MFETPMVLHADPLPTTGEEMLVRSNRIQGVVFVSTCTSAHSRLVMTDAKNC